MQDGFLYALHTAELYTDFFYPLFLDKVSIEGKLVIANTKL